jgi:hypothetical protein
MDHRPGNDPAQRGPAQTFRTATASLGRDHERVHGLSAPGFGDRSHGEPFRSPPSRQGTKAGTGSPESRQHRNPSAPDSGDRPYFGSRSGPRLDRSHRRRALRHGRLGHPTLRAPSHSDHSPAAAPGEHLGPNHRHPPPFERTARFNSLGFDPGKPRPPALGSASRNALALWSPPRPAATGGIAQPSATGPSPSTDGSQRPHAPPLSIRQPPEFHQPRQRRAHASAGAAGSRRRACRRWHDPARAADRLSRKRSAERPTPDPAGRGTQRPTAAESGPARIGVWNAPP